MICGNGKMPVELTIIILFFSFSLIESVYTNLIIYRTCYLIMGYNQTECALLGSQTKDNATAYLEKLVQPKASIINMSRGLIESIGTAIICLFIGPWSDRFGRKPLIIGPLIGYAVSLSGIATFSALPNVSPWWSLLFTIPVILTGGFSTCITGILSYITDTTSDDNRGMRMAFFEASFGLGMFFGSMSSSYIFYATSYATVFCIAAFCVTINVLLVYFFIPESLENRETQGYINGFFQKQNLTDMLQSTFRRREKFNRGIILLITLMLTVYIFAINADGSVIFLYLREKFHWSLKKYTLFSSVNSILWMLGTFGGVYLLHKVLKVTESVIILMGFMSMLNGHLMQGLATLDYHIYAAAVVKIMGGVLSPMSRSLVSKLAPTEIGKVFAMIMTCESLFGIFGSPLYTEIYNNTINTEPATFSFVTAGIYTLESLLTITVIILEFIGCNSTNYNTLQNEEGEERNETEIVNT